MDYYAMKGDYEESKRQIKITTAYTILEYRFPDKDLSFITDLSAEELDRIIDIISIISWDELIAYKK